MCLLILRVEEAKRDLCDTLITSILLTGLSYLVPRLLHKSEMLGG